MNDCDTERQLTPLIMDGASEHDSNLRAWQSMDKFLKYLLSYRRSLQTSKNASLGMFIASFNNEHAIVIEVLIKNCNNNKEKERKKRERKRWGRRI